MPILCLLCQFIHITYLLRVIRYWLSGAEQLRHGTARWRLSWRLSGGKNKLPRDLCHLFRFFLLLFFFYSSLFSPHIIEDDLGNVLWLELTPVPPPQGLQGPLCVSTLHPCPDMWNWYRNLCSTSILRQLPQCNLLSWLKIKPPTLTPLFSCGT